MNRKDTWLTAQLAELGVNVTKQSVQAWRTGASEPSKEKVRALERVFDLAPGALSRTLGYLPLDAVPVISVEDAIAADVRLDEVDRQVVSGVYRSRLDT